MLTKPHYTLHHILYYTTRILYHIYVYLAYYVTHTIYTIPYTTIHYIEGKEDEWKTVTLARLIAANGFIRAENIQVHIDVHSIELCILYVLYCIMCEY